MNFDLRFNHEEVRSWSARYGDDSQDAVPDRVGASAKRRGFLEKEEFLDVARWKSPRTQTLCASNPPEFVRDVTQVALSTTNERVAIEVLTLLRGVSWPTASVFLHYCAPRPYPILDFRALWSLSCNATTANYNFALWQDYVAYTRMLAASVGVSMRELDRALWAYSKANQPVGS